MKPVREARAAQARLSSVVIADGSVVVQGLLSRWIADAGGIHILAVAGDGETAIAQAARHRPDLMILDLDLPRLDGLAALPLVLRESPRTAVLVSGAANEHTARLALQSMTIGATDVIAKPGSRSGLTLSQDFRAELLVKLRNLAQTHGHGPSAPPAHPAAADLSALAGPAPPRYLLIGASTGGPRAVARVLGDIGAALADVTTLVVQHMPPLFTASFAEQLAVQLGVPAREPHDGERLCRGTIYIAPGGRHLGIARRLGHPVAHVSDGPPVSFCRPAVDVLFGDAAQHVGPAALGLVLTGMGSDGTDGAAALRKAGALVIAQDEPSSTVWGMPGSVVKAGRANAVLALGAIGPAIRALVSGGGAS